VAENREEHTRPPNSGAGETRLAREAQQRHEAQRPGHGQVFAYAATRVPTGRLGEDALLNIAEAAGGLMLRGDEASIATRLRRRGYDGPLLIIRPSTSRLPTVVGLRCRSGVTGATTAG
jgi:hypothetical protein